jgi:hypothetical protein
MLVKSFRPWSSNRQAGMSILRLPHAPNRDAPEDSSFFSYRRQTSAPQYWPIWRFTQTRQ